MKDKKGKDLLVLSFAVNLRIGIDDSFKDEAPTMCLYRHFCKILLFHVYCDTYSVNNLSAKKCSLYDYLARIG